MLASQGAVLTLPAERMQVVVLRVALAAEGPVLTFGTAGALAAADGRTLACGGSVLDSGHAPPTATAMVRPRCTPLLGLDGSLPPATGGLSTSGALAAPAVPALPAPAPALPSAVLLAPALWGRTICKNQGAGVREGDGKVTPAPGHCQASQTQAGKHQEEGAPVSEWTPASGRCGEP